MGLTNNPETIRLSVDVANYRRDFDDTSKPAKKEIKEKLKKHNSTKYPDTAPDFVFKMFGAYQDFAYGGNEPERRLGGILDQTTPQPPPAHKQNTEEFIDYVADHQTGKTGKVHVLANGTILHDGITGDDGEATHHYMHHVFDHILYKTRDLAEGINRALSWYNEVVPLGSTSQEVKDAIKAYENAITAFEDFRDKGTGNIFYDAFTTTVVGGVTKKAVNVMPVITIEGYYVSARVELNWKNPYHSSSTIRVP